MQAEQVLTYQDLLNLVESGKDLAARVELPTLLNDILERAQHLTESDGTSILLADERGGGLYFAAALGPGSSSILTEFGASSLKRVPIQSKAGVVFGSGESIVEESLEEDRDHFKDVDEKTRHVTKRMVCAAMSVVDARSPKRLGVLQIINKRTGPYSERDRVLLEHFAAQAAIAIRNTTMVSNLVAHMGSYTTRDPFDIMEELKAPPSSGLLTVMFADMRGFTRLCQTIRNERKICNMLSEFMTMLADEVLAHGGMVNKKMGDGILALFRPPQGPRNAVQCAFGILERFGALHKQWMEYVPEKIDFLAVGMGIVTDEVMLGTIGTGNMRDFTAIGTPVILASALEKEARGGRHILCDRPTYLAVKDLVNAGTEPFSFALHKPDQPIFTSYDVYPIVRMEAAAKTAGKALRAFLSHASEDREAVGKLFSNLKRDGVDPWLDKDALEGGQEWAAVIPEALRECDVVLVCLSSLSIGKAGYVQKEIRRVVDIADEKPEGSVYVIPVRLEECEIPKSLRRWHCIDLFEPAGYEKLMRALTGGSQAAVARS